MNTALVMAVLTFAASPEGQKMLLNGEQAFRDLVEAIFKHSVKEAHSSLTSAITPIGG